MRTIGDRIRQQRKYKGLTQEQLAKAIGISVMSVRRYEASERTPTEKVLTAISTALDTDTDWLRYGDIDEFQGGLEAIRNAANSVLEKPMKTISDIAISALSDTVQPIISSLLDSLNGLTVEELESLVKYAQFLQHEHEAFQSKESDNNAVNSEDDE